VTVIRHFGPTGTLLGEWEVGPWGPQTANSIGAMTVDPSGVVYVSSWLEQQVLRYDP
jgi:hypothetical protein